MNDTNRQLQANMAEGRTRYAKQIVTWNQRNGHIPQDTLAIWTTGYPLSPGTALPCSGECWKCGMVTTPLHRACTAPLVPVLERRYRATCGQWFGRIHNVAVNRVEVEEMEGVPWYEAEHDDAVQGEDF